MELKMFLRILATAAQALGMGAVIVLAVMAAEDERVQKRWEHYRRLWAYRVRKARRQKATLRLGWWKAKTIRTRIARPR
jgi:hypothetical protein